MIAMILAALALIPTLSVTPNPAQPYEPVTVGGCGYMQSVWVTINDGLGFGEQTIDAAGCFELHWYAGPTDETYRVYDNAKQHGQPIAETVLAVR